MNVTTQDAQVAVFENAARHLRDGGCFVVEVMVPELRRLPPGATRVDIDEYDLVHQGLISHHPTGSIPFRYVWPAELDMMARIAGLRLRERYEDWDRSPYTHESRKTISVWER